jgi:hypothetical protein
VGATGKVPLAPRPASLDRAEAVVVWIESRTTSDDGARSSGPLGSRAPDCKCIRWTQGGRRYRRFVRFHGGEGGVEGMVSWKGPGKVLERSWNRGGRPRTRRQSGGPGASMRQPAKSRAASSRTVMGPWGGGQRKRGREEAERRSDEGRGGGQRLAPGGGRGRAAWGREEGLDGQEGGAGLDNARGGLLFCSGWDVAVASIWEGQAGLHAGQDTSMRALGRPGCVVRGPTWRGR